MKVSVVDIEDMAQARIGTEVFTIISRDVVPLFVKEAMKRIAPFCDNVHYVVFNVSGSASFTMPEDCQSVIDVFEATGTLSDMASDPFFLQANIFQGDISGMVSNPLEGLREKVHYFDGTKLYLYGYFGEVTVKYSAAISMEDNLDSYYTQWIENYALALIKEAVGNKLNLFQIESPLTVNSGDLLSQAQEERTDLIDELRDRVKGPIRNMR